MDLRSITVVVLVAMAAFCDMGSCEYVPNSILCDDIEAICAFHDMTYDADNLTACGTQERFLNPAICNCGHKCMAPLEEDDSCATSSVRFFPDEICGDQLECISRETGGTNAKCRYDTEHECIAKAHEYDEGFTEGSVGPGQYRPNCNDDGSYAPKQCSPGGTCYCVDKENNRLFGEAVSTDSDSMDCDCAIYWEDAKSRGLTSGLRCLMNGNFDPLTCMDRLCYCYDHAKNIVDGPYPRSSMINLYCYDDTIHNPDYINVCTRDQEAWDNYMADNSTIIIDIKRRPVCSHDGYYSPVQAIGGSLYCADPYGERIENFTAPIADTDTVSCNCARRRYFMEMNGLGASKPKCCSNGEYFPYQTRGLIAYCVDTNGNQQGETTPITNIASLVGNCTYTPPCPEDVFDM